VRPFDLDPSVWRFRHSRHPATADQEHRGL